MKPSTLIFALALAVALFVFTGCGKDPAQTVKSDATSSALSTLSAALTAVSCQGATPVVGCYYTDSNNCAPCPTGYVLDGSSCVVSSTKNCKLKWNGFACDTPSGFGCPAGTSFSCQYGGCLATTCKGATNYFCLKFNYGDVLFYVTGAPASDYYFNGFGWNKFQTGQM